jgi:uncharacterized protein (TIGR00730 family)
MTLRITVFCGARPRPGEAAYEQAYLLGQLLGAAGHMVLTGGYIGAMEAVSRGAAEAGGHVIGITCDEIEAWRGVRCNPYVMEEIRYPTLRERLGALIDGCDAAFALPGGAGTLTEISLMWNMLITRAVAPKPLVLIGPAWEAVFSGFFLRLGEYVIERDREWLVFAPDIKTAIEKLPVS